MAKAKRTFKDGDEVIYFPGNWHYVFLSKNPEDGMCTVACIEEDCEVCETEGAHEEEIHESELLSYEDYSDHGCNECEHETLLSWKTCKIKFD